MRARALICEPLRTPVGRFGGVFRDLPAATLAATVIAELVRRTEIPPAAIDDVLLGQCYANGEAASSSRSMQAYRSRSRGCRSTAAAGPGCKR